MSTLQEQLRQVVDQSYDFHTEDEWVTVPGHPEHELAGDLLRALREVPT